MFKANTLLLLILLLTIFSCTNNRRPNNDSNSDSTSTSDSIAQVASDTTPPKSDAEQTSDFIEQLFENGADTVLFYDRTCINCCDFYTIFWMLNGKRYYHKFYDNFDIKNSLSTFAELKNDRIFDELKANLSTLKKTSTKENTAKMANGESQMMMTVHHCFSLVKVYSKNDSLVASHMKDFDFEKYSGIETKNGKSLPNINYRSNIQSKWYTLLTAIENEISLMPETSDEERKVMRKSK